MNNRIDKTLKHARETGRTVIVPYITVGFPQMETFKDIALGLVEAGVDMLELGIPFSDPLADGPTIQETSFKALENGVNLSSSLGAVSDLRAIDDKTPMIFMGYYKFNVQRFAATLMVCIQVNSCSGLYVCSFVRDNPPLPYLL